MLGTDHLRQEGIGVALTFNLLFRWFVGLGIDDPVWVPTVFTKNRDRLLSTDMSRKIMAAILAHRQVAPLLSDGPFSVDGTLVKAWASMKSVQPRADQTLPDDDPEDPPGPDAPAADPTAPTATETDPMPRKSRHSRNAEVDFRGQKRTNASHGSTTDPDARLYRKSPGTGTMLCFIGHALMENRSGLIVQGDLTRADGRAERRAALDMIHRHSPGSTRRLTLGADRGFDAAGFAPSLCHSACRAEIETFGDRGPNDPAPGLRPIPAPPQAHRGSLRLGQDRRRHGPDRLSRPREGALPLHPHHGRQQSRPAPEAAGCLKAQGDSRHGAC